MTYQTYYQLNKESLLEKAKASRDANKEICKIKEKEYRDANNETIKIKDKKWRDANKDKRNKKFDCECGGKYSLQQKSSHLKTMKHINWKLENKSN